MPHVKIQIRGLDKTLRHLGETRARTRRMKPAFEVVAQQVRNGTLRNFRRGGWWPASWARSARAAAEGGKTLVDNAVLRNSIHAVATDRYAKVGSDVVYAAIHQYGGECGRNHATVLPARPFLPVDANGNVEPGIMRRARRTIAGWVMEGRLNG